MKKALIAGLVTISVCSIALASYYLYPAYKQKEARKAYVEAAQKVIDGFDRISAGIDVGLNYLEFSKRMADLNYQLIKFDEKYGQNPQTKQANSFKAIQSVAESYKKALAFWHKKINIPHEQIKLKALLKNSEIHYSLRESYVSETRESLESDYRREAESAVFGEFVWAGVLLEIAKGAINNKNQEEHIDIAKLISDVNKEREMREIKIKRKLELVIY